MSIGIYGVSSWDVVEPTTFLVSAFWLMTGSAFFIKNKVDFSYESGLEHYHSRSLDKLIEDKKFDTEKKEFLENYLAELDQYINVL